MKKILVVVLAMLMLVLAVSCNKDGTPDGMQNASIEGAAYNFYVPDTWVTVTESGVSCAKATVGNNAPNATLTVYYPDSVITPNDHWQVNCLPEYRTVLQNIVVHEDGSDVTLGGKDAKKYVFSYTVGTDSYQCQQVIAVYDYQVYVLTYTALADAYDTHVADVESMLTHFAFK